GADWAAKPELVRKLQFRQHNLTLDPAPAGMFDIILCRNVMLYFSLAVRRKVFDSLASAMRPGGLLALGAGETVIGQTDHFTPCERYRGFYRPVDGPGTLRAAG
ncbi:MAG: methyltransferase domain-containing protein, partial [Bradyrhizobium sp.]|nr:methyltransferase domain-containing protein [Bradyrhizobium sp.]